MKKLFWLPLFVGGIAFSQVTDTGDKVGIGTTTPQEKLDVNGQAIINGGVGVASSGTLQIRQKGDFSGDGIAITSSHSTSHRLWKDTNGSLNIGPSGYPSTIVSTTSGKVGIGTSLPSAQLHLYSNNGTEYNTFFDTNSMNFETSSNAPSYINKKDTGSLRFRMGASYNTAMTINNNGNIGIGTTTPTKKLDVEGDFRFSHGSNELLFGASVNNTLTYQVNTTGGWARQLRIGNNNGIQKFVGFGGYGSGSTNTVTYAYIDASGSPAYNNTQQFRLYANGNATLPNGNFGIGTILPVATSEPSSVETSLHIKNNMVSTGDVEVARFQGGNDADNTAAVVRINHSNDRGLYLKGGRRVGDKSFAELGIIGTTGNLESPSITFDDIGRVGIGTISPDAKLAVKGNIHTQEVKVDLLGAVMPDYVFKEDYNLKTLAEVEEYIDTNGHLPDIPSAKVVDAEGLLLKEMNLKLLQKIEELTLYTIDQEKRIKSLESKNEKLMALAEKLLDNKNEK